MIVSSIEQPSWFSPKKLLVIFCVINLINYVDRGAIASNGVNGSLGTCTGDMCTSGTGIQGDFDLSNFEDGCLSSAFMVGLLVASPIFASLAKSVNPFRLIGVGLSVWTFAVVGCGISFNFWSITICRILVGVGEASFISLAAPFIDDNAPAAQHILWPFLLKMIIPKAYTGVVAMVCRCISELCRHRSSNSDTMVKECKARADIPNPEELFVRLVVLLHDPLAREQLAS